MAQAWRTVCTGGRLHAEEDRAGMPHGTGLAGLAKPSRAKTRWEQQARARLLCVPRDVRAQWGTSI